MYSSITDDFKSAFDKPNNGHVQLIIINVVVFVALGLIKVIMSLAEADEIYHMIDRQFSIPPTFGEFITRPWSAITYMFNHGGIWHILFNMLWFYYFGRLIIEYLGNDKMISIYVIGGLAGAAAYLLMYNVVPYYIDRSSGLMGMVGASAAVDAIIVAAAVLLPNYTVQLLFFGPVKIKYIALFSIVISLLSITGGNAGGNIAHLGGAAIGFLYIRSIQGGTDIGKWVITVMNFFKSFFVRQPAMKVNYSRKTKSKSAGKTAEKSTGTNITDQQEIDAILDKISQSGYESLSKEEKQKLFNASKK